MSQIPSLKRAVFLRTLVRLGVTCTPARGGGSQVKLERGAHYDSFHVHPSAELGPRLVVKILRRLGISVEEFLSAL